MTAYELLDLRGATSDTYWTILRSWLTVTFACFGAANLITGEIVFINSGLLFVFYGSVTFSMLKYLSQIQKELDALESDLEQAAQSEEARPSVLKPEIVRSRLMMVRYQQVTGTAGVIALGVYLWALNSIGA